MNQFLWTVLLLIGLLSLSVNTYASGGYKCTVLEAKQLSNAGKMEVSKFTKQYIGKEFVVDKKTGRMTGQVKNHNFNGEPKVLDQGSAQQAYKAITIFSPFTTVDYLYIQAFAEGPKKPFYFIDLGDNILTGTCENY